jgi:cell wall-associated NlpC family hydrolase
LRARALVAVVGSLTVSCVLAPAALAVETGGAAPGGPAAPAPAPAPAATAPAPAAPHALHYSPITARSSHLSYRGPVYERLSSGEIVPYQPAAPAGQLSSASGGSPIGTAADTKPLLLVPGSLARLIGGIAAAPMSAPPAVQAMIWAGDQIVGLPYIYGGGHESFVSPGYDCSGTVSFALHGAGWLAVPEDSSELETYSSHGQGRWVTVFANPGHAYADVAGLRLDTSAADDPTNQQGPRWRPLRRNNSGYTLRHPLGF